MTPTYTAFTSGQRSYDQSFPFNVSITPTGDNRVVFAFVMINKGGGGQSIDYIRYNGNAMTLVAKYNQTNYYIAIYKYVNPPASSKSITTYVSGTGSWSVDIGVVAVDNADQTNPVGTYGNIETSEVTCNSQSGVMSKQITTGYNNSLVLAYIAATGSCTWTPGSGQTEIADWNNNSMSYKEAATAGNVTMSETISACSLNMLIVLEVKEVQSSRGTYKGLSASSVSTKKGLAIASIASAKGLA